MKFAAQCPLSIGMTRKAVNLRFLFGALLDDPGGVFRAGAGRVLRTMDFAAIDEADE